MFLSTLGVKKDIIVTTALNKTSEGQLKPSPDLRGCHEPGNKFPEEVLKCIRSHVLFYNPSISHYRREQAPIVLIEPKLQA